MNGAKECYVDITTAADPAAAVARLNNERLHKLERWLDAKGFDTGFMGVAHGLVLLEQASRWRKGRKDDGASADDNMKSALEEEGMFP